MVIRETLDRWLAVLVVAAIGCVVVAWCVRAEYVRVQSVKVGMPQREVVRILGEPTGRFEGATLNSIVLPETIPCRSKAVACLGYERFGRRSFLVYLDSRGLVACTAVLPVYGMRPLI